MRRRILLAAALLMAVTGYVKAQKPAYITFSQPVLPQGGTGEMEVYYQTDDANKFKAFQIDVPLPEGITIEENVEMAQPLPLTGIEKGTYDDLKDMTPEQAKSKFFATAKNKSDKSVVIGFQTGDQTFPASSEPTLLCTLTLKATEDVTTDYTGYSSLTDYIELTNSETKAISTEPNEIGSPVIEKQNLNIKVFKKGDVNGDGKLNIADVVCLINYLNYLDGLTNPVFYKSMAIVNQSIDNKINIADVVSLINILNNSPQQAPKHEEFLLDPQ